MEEKIDFFKISFNIYVETLLRLSAVYINTYMISRYDILLLAAMSGANQVFMLSSTMIGFLTFGSSILISQALGAGRKTIAIRAIHINISFNFCIGLACFAFAFFNGAWVLDILNIPKDIQSESLLYLKAISVLILIDCIFQTFSSILRVYARTKELMIVAFMMNIINVAFNFLFLFHYELGLFGIGLSSIISRIIALICLIYVYFRLLKLRIYLPLFFKSSLDTLKKILKMGIFSGGESLLGSIQYMVIFSFIAMLGSKYLSVQMIYFQISIFLFTFSVALSSANRIIIGRLVGKKDFDAAYFHTNKVLKYALILNLATVILVYFLSDFITQFLGFSEELRKIIKPLFLISFVLELARGLNQVLTAALKASADVVYPSFVAIICMWAVGVPLAYLLAFNFNLALSGIWMAFCIEELVKSLFNISRWCSKKWQNKILV